MNRIEKMAAYVAPTVEVIEIVVEQGYSLSSDTNGNADGWHGWQ